MTELTEKERENVEAPNDEMQRGIRTLDIECEKCGAKQVAPRIGKIFTLDKMCYECGTIQDRDKSTTKSDSTSSSGQSKTREEAKKDATKNTGKMLQMVGLLFTLTVVGAVIGIPLLVVGMHIETKGMDNEDN